MKWSKGNEDLAIELRAKGITYTEIGERLGTTATSVKHKVRRIQQAGNLDRYKHTEEKSEQFYSVIEHEHVADIRTLETHSGFGGMSEVYSRHGSVVAYDISADRVEGLASRGLPNVEVIKGDSEKCLYSLIAGKSTFDIVDIDPYGLPSRYFPHAFSLVKNGLMFLTFPVMGVAQINKITIRHYQAFWGIELSDKDQYIDKVKAKLVDFGFQHKREVTFLDVRKIGRIYRIAMKVEVKSLCDIVGLVVNRS